MQAVRGGAHTESGWDLRSSANQPKSVESHTAADAARLRSCAASEALNKHVLVLETHYCQAAADRNPKSFYTVPTQAKKRTLFR